MAHDPKHHLQYHRPATLSHRCRAGGTHGSPRSYRLSHRSRHDYQHDLLALWLHTPRHDGTRGSGLRTARQLRHQSSAGSWHYHGAPLHDRRTTRLSLRHAPERSRHRWCYGATRHRDRAIHPNHLLRSPCGNAHLRPQRMVHRNAKQSCPDDCLHECTVGQLPRLLYPRRPLPDGCRGSCYWYLRCAV